MNQQEKINHLIQHSAKEWDRQNVQGVIDACKKILDLDANHCAALGNMGTALWASGRPKEAESNYRRALAINPEYMEALLNLGTLHADNGNLEASWEYIDKAHKLRPFHADLMWRKSIIQLAWGDYINGWAGYEEGLGIASIRGKLLEFKSAPWKGNACNHLLICHEQGYGDTLQFIRYAQLCKTRARKVYVLCPRELHKIISSCPWVDGVMETAHDGDFEEYTYTMSLPHIFGTTLESVPAPIPYLSPSPEALSAWTPKFEGVKGLRVGIVWAGNPRKQEIRFRVIDAKRSIGLDCLAPLLDMPVNFYSLQKGETEADAAKYPQIVNFMPDINDFDDTAAIIANLDLVISVDTSVVHLAGAMGKPVWLLSRKDACWRWLQNREDSPWYPSVRVYGQTEIGDWDSVIERVKQDLEKLV